MPGCLQSIKKNPPVNRGTLQLVWVNNLLYYESLDDCLSVIIFTAQRSYRNGKGTGSCQLFSNPSAAMDNPYFRNAAYRE